MSFEIHRFNELPYEKQHEIAVLISLYTKGRLGEKPQMLPVEPADIMAKHLGFAALESEDDFAGYVGAIEPVQYSGVAMPEVGSLWVPLGHRKKGIAHGLVESVSHELAAMGELPYALCNSLSLKIFEQTGYQPAGMEDIPPAAIAACANCPFNPKNGQCCDTPMIFAGGLE